MKIADLQIRSTIFIGSNHKFDIKTYKTKSLVVLGPGAEFLRFSNNWGD